MEPVRNSQAARQFVLCFCGATLALLGTAAAVNYILDPFGFRSAGGWPTGKLEVAYLINKRVATLARLERQPASSVVIGDSRAAKIDDALLSRMTGKSWTNLAFGGATLEEMASLYEHATRGEGLELAVIVMPFNRFTRSYQVDGIEEALRVTGQRWKLHTSIFELRASLEIALFGLTGRQLRSDEPAMTPEAFADFQVQREESSAFTLDAQVHARRRLQQLVESARRSGVRIVWMAPPAHPRMLRIYETRFATEFDAYKQWMRQAGEFVDFEQAGFESRLGMTARFKDLLHLDQLSTDALARALLREISAATPQSGGVSEHSIEPTTAPAEL